MAPIAVGLLAALTPHRAAIYFRFLQNRNRRQNTTCIVFCPRLFVGYSAMLSDTALIRPGTLVPGELRNYSLTFSTALITLW